MIVTVTPNPSVDRTMFIDALPRGRVIRSQRVQSEPSGKGVNVALALRARGHAALAVLPVGGATGLELARMLTELDVAHVAVPIAGSIRNNISLVEPDGTVTKINEPGPVLADIEVDALSATALGHNGPVAWLAGCGSLPHGAATEFYAKLTAAGRRSGVRTAIDTSGSALKHVLPQRPDLVAPNADELAEVTGRTLETLGDVVDAAQTLRDFGVPAVLASLGRDGAILIDGNGAVHGDAQVSKVVSAVGAGDALLAGFLAAGGDGSDALRQGLIWAAATVQQGGTLSSDRGPPVTARIHDSIDRRRRLTPSPGQGVATLRP